MLHEWRKVLGIHKVYQLVDALICYPFDGPIRLAINYYTPMTSFKCLLKNPQITTYLFLPKFLQTNKNMNTMTGKYSKKSDDSDATLLVAFRFYKDNPLLKIAHSSCNGKNHCYKIRYHITLHTTVWMTTKTMGHLMIGNQFIHSSSLVLASSTFFYPPLHLREYTTPADFLNYSICSSTAPLHCTVPLLPPELWFSKQYNLTHFHHLISQI